MEIRIGIQNSGRELSLESAENFEAVAAKVEAALGADTGILRLEDEKGRTVLVPASTLAYVEVQPQQARKVGFAG